MVLEKNLKFYKQKFYLKKAVTFQRVLSQTVLSYKTFTKILKYLQSHLI